MKKLFLALSLLLVSAILMSVASYAWFSMNTTVSATNMQVTATTSRNLVISLDTDPLSFHQTVDTDSAMAEMYPVSTSDLANWFTTTPAGIAKIDYDTGGLLADVTSFASGDFKAAVNDSPEENYYLAQNFKIKISNEGGAGFTDLYVSHIDVDRGETELEISQSLRVGVKVGDNVYIYAPVDGAQTGYGAVKDISGGTDDVTALTAYTSESTLGAVTSTAEVSVDVFIWYEGADKNCKSANAIATEKLTVGIEFSAVDTPVEP